MRARRSGRHVSQGASGPASGRVQSQVSDGSRRLWASIDDGHEAVDHWILRDIVVSSHSHSIGRLTDGAGRHRNPRDGQPLGREYSMVVRICRQPFSTDTVEQQIPEIVVTELHHRDRAAVRLFVVDHTTEEVPRLFEYGSAVWRLSQRLHGEMRRTRARFSPTRRTAARQSNALHSKVTLASCVRLVTSVSKDDLTTTFTSSSACTTPSTTPVRF